MLDMKNVFVGLMFGSALVALAIAQTKSTTPATKSTKSAASKGTATKTTSAVRRVTSSSAGRAATGAAKTAATAGNLMNPATLTAKAPAQFTVSLNTSKGPVVIEVTRAWSPNGADRFYNLVRGGFFNDIYFFRVIPGFMAQFGMSSKPEIQAVWDNKTMPDDPPAGQHNTRGMVSFAKTGAPNSRSTQIFINFGDNSRLDPTGFTPFGKVSEGMENVDQFYSGYGEQSDDQQAIKTRGKAYLNGYPMLDKIITASVTSQTPAAATSASGAPRPRAASGAVRKVTSSALKK